MQEEVCSLSGCVSGDEDEDQEFLNKEEKDLEIQTQAEQEIQVVAF